MSIACIACHGIGLKAAGSPAPDLRESQVALNADAFYAVVHDGALNERGMPKFDFTPGQVQKLRAYVRATAREALGTRKPSGDEPAAAHF
jgi:quinohemoprotein ethanol dehydrogenase